MNVIPFPARMPRPASDPLAPVAPTQAALDMLFADQGFQNVGNVHNFVWYQRRHNKRVTPRKK